MNYSEFIGEVQHRIDASQQGEAVRATRAVLATLGERIQGSEAEDLASPLPMEIDRYLTEAESGQRFDYREFLERVAERGECDEADAAFAAQAVVALVGELAPGSEMSDVRDQLPDDYGDLFEFVDAASPPW